MNTNRFEKYKLKFTTIIDKETITDFVKNEVPKYKNKTNTVPQFKIKNIFKKTYKIKESPFTSYIFDTLKDIMTEIYGDVIISTDGYDYYRMRVKNR